MRLRRESALGCSLAIAEYDRLVQSVWDCSSRMFRSRTTSAPERHRGPDKRALAWPHSDSERLHLPGTKQTGNELPARIPLERWRKETPARCRFHRSVSGGIRRVSVALSGNP